MMTRQNGLVIVPVAAITLGFILARGSKLPRGKELWQTALLGCLSFRSGEKEGQHFDKLSANGV